MQDGQIFFKVGKFFFSLIAESSTICFTYHQNYKISKILTVLDFKRVENMVKLIENGVQFTRELFDDGINGSEVPEESIPKIHVNPKRKGKETKRATCLSIN